jgi:transposase
MNHIGIDLGATHSHVVVLSASGELQLQKKVKTTELPHWLQRQAASHVVMEACTQSPAIGRAAREARHVTKIVPAQFVKLLGVGARGIKTDGRDAGALARASLHNDQLPSVHVRSEQSYSRRELISSRALLVKSRRSIAVSIKSWLRGRLVMLRGRASSHVFCDAVRKAALEQPDGLPIAIELLLQSFEHLTEQIAALDELISNAAGKDAVCERLMTIPGVGPQIALAFVTHLDCPGRFGSADELASYLALVPGEATTGGKVVRTRTIKAGPKYLKALLIQAAWGLWRSRPTDPVVLWARAIADKRGNCTAIVALARKLATMMWSMWKHGTAYNPAQASSMRIRVESHSAPS